MIHCWKNVIKPGIKSVIVLKKNLVVHQCTINLKKKKKKIYEGKINIQIFMKMNFQEKVLTAFVYQ